MADTDYGSWGLVVVERLRTSVLAAILVLAAADAFAGRLHPALEEQLKAAVPREKLRVIVEMKEQLRARDVVPANARAARRAKLRALVSALKDKAQRNQVSLRAELARQQTLGAVERMTPFWIFNGFAVTADEAVIRSLAAREDVLEVRLDAQIPPPPRPTGAGSASGTTEWNIEKIRAPEVWALDPTYDGTGSVVGSFDTGVDLSHPDLFPRYRGDDAISWFDPYGEHSFPVDPHGHGTHTTGTAVGGNAGGSQIGVAPGAKWIAAKAWNDSGYGFASDFHRIFEWFLAPGGDPDNAPDVVNNSWALIVAGCDIEFAPDIQAWRAAEIFPAVAAGNAGPATGSVRSPGALPESFSVGATDVFDEIAGFSGRGPSPCGDLVKPDISAPGVEVYSAVPGGYTTFSGTSMATPHITGAVAVLRSIKPEMSVDELGAALTLGAQDIAEPGADNDSGQGRLDLFVSAQIAINGLDRPVVKVLSTVATAAELGATPGMFTVSRTGNTDAPLEVMISVAGTAIAGSDYIALPSSVTIPAGSSTLAVPVVPIDDDVAEFNESVALAITAHPSYIVASARLATVIVVSDEQFPDLIVTGFTAPTSAAAGQSITVTETTKNQGGAAGASVTQYLLSANPGLDASDVGLGSRNIPALAAGAGSAGSTLVTIPLDAAAGTWYLIARADSTQAVDESAENNNLGLRAIRIGPDLIVTALSAPTVAGAGQSLTITETTKNQGAGPAVATVTQYYLSANTTLDAADVLLGARAVPALAGGADSPGSTVVTIPSDATTGTWYLIAKSDAMNGVVESLESNNTTLRAVQIGPDLVVTALSAPASGGAGQSLTISETTRNQGASPAEPSVTQYYLSANPALDASDLFLGARDVPALAGDAGSPGSTVVTIPPGITTGTWYLIAKADVPNAVVESIESNNVAFRSIRIGVDLYLTTLSVPASAGAGQSIVISDTTRNQGGALSPASVTRYYLSANGALDAADVPLGAREVPALDAGASSSASTTLTVPADTAVGTWYVIAKADGMDAIVETVETNNAIGRHIQVGPDLLVSAFIVPAAAAAGQTLSVTDTTKNQGAGAALASTTRYHLSSDSALDASDVQLGSRDVPALAAGASNTGSVALAIPPDTSTGTWYLIAEADGTEALTETSETNNLAVRAVRIGPDLVVSALSAPSASGAGQNVTITETTRNQGAGAAQPSVTRYYLSTNSTLDAADVLLASRDIPLLNAGASDAATTVASVPLDTAPGTWYFLARVDATETVIETLETNNLSSRLVRIGPDLVISSVSASSSVAAGQSLTITDTTRNQGAAPAEASVTHYFLSTNSTLDAADVPLGSRDVPALGAGASNSASTALTIPAGTAPGTWYLIAKADAPGSIAESIETNNTAARTLQVSASTP